MTRPRYAMISIEQRSFTLFVKNIALGGTKTAGGLLDGINSIARGATQLISTPLTWFLRMPLRGIITAIKGKPTIQQNLKKRVEKLEILINKNDKTLEDTIRIDKEMESITLRMIKAKERKQEIGAVDCGKMVEKHLYCQAFTKRTITFKGILYAQQHGYVPDEAYAYSPNDSKTARTKALSFLGLFKANEMGAATDEKTEDSNMEELFEKIFGVPPMPPTP